MCTSIAWKNGNFYFGRNLDLECEFGERVVVTPRKYPIEFRRAGRMERHYAILGMAAVEGGYPLYAEAVNEKGLCIAGLNFPGNARYLPAAQAQGEAIAPFELPLWLLGQCATLAQARERLRGASIVDIAFSESLPLSPLHWHIADAEGSVTLECTQAGMQMYENSIGVLTNNPPFDFHCANLCQYLNLTPQHPENRFGASLNLRPFGRGMGSIGLPGDFSSASRFVKAAFLRANSVCGGAENDSVAQFFHLLDAVAMPRGSVQVEDGRQEYTVYSCCINASRGIYYYKTYENSVPTAVDLWGENLDGCELREYPKRKQWQIQWENRG